MKKVVGYILAGVGLLGLVTSVFKPLKEKLLGPVSAGISDGLGVSLLVLSLILLGVGVVLLFVAGRGGGSNKQKKKEVPIYKGKEIIGYRQE